jgi:hypothetical protein
MLGPVIAPVAAYGSIPITIYVIRRLNSESLESLIATIDAELHNRQGHVSTSIDVPPQAQQRYTIKSLSDYISEGLEDELLPVELKYWREENQRRLNRDEANLGNGLV